jgi:hypothetical protein
VRYDSTSSFTATDRIKQQECTKELFGMVEDLAYLVYQIDEWDAKAQDFKAKNGKPNKTVDALIKELTALRNILVVTTGDNYVGAAEDQLREKINEIYGTIVGYFGAPSESELANVKGLKNQLISAQKTFNVLKDGKIKEFSSILTKSTSVAVPEILSKEAFLKQ